ncbi:MAG: VWA domain-containing protein [Anaerolineaceae bacterium]|nr:VWA domain-containing protein [Anaerolineaceae bacterium]MCB9098582.1 VWA domain-containing protein [Anaerolineales bacterium]
MAQKIDRTQMHEVPAVQIVEPFAKVNYWDMPNGGGRMILAFIKMDVTREGAKMGIAIDGSGSMEDLFGKKPLSAFIPAPPNHVRPAAQAMSTYLAKKSADGKVAIIYWATGPGGKDIQMLGDLTAEEAGKFTFDPPAHYGTGTQLLPALQYFTDGQQRRDLFDAPWGMYVFITDGAIEDLEAVKQYCTQMAKDIDAGRRNDLKLVIIGLGNQVDREQMDELDDLETGTEVDLWDTKLASEMKDLSEIFAEVVEEGTILVPGDGIIKDNQGNIIIDYRDTGLPGILEFTLPPSSKSFHLEVAGNTSSQPLP